MRVGSKSGYLVGSFFFGGAARYSEDLTKGPEFEELPIC